MGFTVKPANMSAATGIANFAEGINNGLGIVRDVNRIKSLKAEDTRQQDEANRKKIEFDQGQEDRKTKLSDEDAARAAKVQEYNKKYRQGAISAAFAGQSEDAANIWNHQGFGKKAKAITKVQDDSGSPTVEFTFDDDSKFMADPSYVRYLANGSENPTPNSTTGEITPVKDAQFALDRYKVQQAEVARLQAKALDVGATAADKKAFKQAESTLADLAQKAGIGTGIPPAADDELPTDPKTGEPLRPSQMPNAAARIKANRDAGYPPGGIPAAGAVQPAATPTQAPASAAPAPSAGAPVSMTSPSGKTYQIKAEAVDKYKAAGWTVGGQ